MRQDLFYIPHELAGVPVFGIGWVLLLWMAGSLIALKMMVKRQGFSEETRSFLPFLAIVGLAIAFLLPRIEKPDVGLPIRGYGVFLLIATLSGLGLAMRRAKQVGLAPDVILGLAFHMFVGGILGARLFFVIQYWDPPPPAEGIYDPESVGRTIANMLNFMEGGPVVYGSLIGGLIAAVWYLKKHALPLLPIADLIAPSMALGLAIGRWGCLMNGCCFGGVCDQPWAITFPPQSPPYADQQRSGLLHGFRLAEDTQGRPVVGEVDPDGPAYAAGVRSGSKVTAVFDQPVNSRMEAKAQLGRAGLDMAVTTDGGRHVWAVTGLPARSLPVHPTQIYSSINAALLACVAFFHFPCRRRDGETFVLLLALYGVTRFLLEMIRTDEPGLWQTGMTISQNVSVLILVFVAGLTVVVWRGARGSFWPPASAP